MCSVRVGGGVGRGGVLRGGGGGGLGRAPGSCPGSGLPPRVTFGRRWLGRCYHQEGLESGVGAGGSDGEPP